MNNNITFREFMLPMPDGVHLYTRCEYPGDGKYPAVLIRTPYEEGRGSACRDENARLFLEHGYVVVTQHVRGRGESEGVCVPYDEHDDGLATIEHIRNMPFYNGEIFLTGGSYLASAHLCSLADAPTDIKGAALSIQTDRLYFRNFKNGCNYNLNNFEWWLRMLSRRYPDARMETPPLRPYADIAKRVLGEDLASYTDGLIHDTCDGVHTSDSRWNVMDTLSIPILLTEGWYDFYIDGMIDMWRRMPEETRCRSAMIIGPYAHDVKVGKSSDYPLENAELPESYIVDWFDSIREGGEYPHVPLGKLKYYSVGEGRWYVTDDLDACRDRLRLYLTDTGKLGKRVAKTGVFSYKYDPDNSPSPYRYRGALRAHAPNSVVGVLSFVGEPFIKGHSFFGEIEVHLEVSTDCEDTAFFVRVYLVEGGESYTLTETAGALSALVDSYVPGERVAIKLVTPHMAFTVKRGSTIRIDVSSVSGMYMPHANVKGHFALVNSTRVATNSVFVGKSYIELKLSKK